MPRRNETKSAGRVVGRGNKRTTGGITQRQLLWLGVLVSYCQTRECAIFVGTMTTTGNISMNFYWNEEKCRASVNTLDNFAEEVPVILSDIFDEEITIKDIERAVPWLAVAAAEVAPDKKASPRSNPEVEAPHRPS